LVDTAKCALDGARPIELSDDQLINDLARIVGVLLALARPAAQVALKAVAAVEELADVLADIVIYHEFSARVVGREAF
jgi:hypothetical protein